MRTKRIKLYKYSELDIKAQEKVLQGYAFIPADKQDLVDYLSEQETEYLQDGTIYTEQ